MSSEAVVFTFGRFQPPTKGHEKLIQTAVNVSKKKNADIVIFVSQTHKAPNNPLPWDYKRKIVQTAFPGLHISDDATVRTPYQALEELAKQYSDVTMVVGDDRVSMFYDGMMPYAEEWGITEFDVVNAGTRDPDVDGIEGVSASKARELAADGNQMEFNDMLSDRLTNEIKQDIYSKLRHSLGLEEDADNKEADAYRNMGLRGEFAYSGHG